MGTIKNLIIKMEEESKLTPEEENFLNSLYPECWMADKPEVANLTLPKVA